MRIILGEFFRVKDRRSPREQMISEIFFVLRIEERQFLIIGELPDIRERMFLEIIPLVEDRRTIVHGDFFSRRSENTVLEDIPEIRS